MDSLTGQSWRDSNLFWAPVGALVGFLGSAAAVVMSGPPLIHVLLSGAWLAATFAAWQVFLNSKPVRMRIVKWSIVTAVISSILFWADSEMTSLANKQNRKIDLVFEISPAFTPQRKHMITMQVKTFHEYMSQMGLHPSIDTPVVGILRGKAPSVRHPYMLVRIPGHPRNSQMFIAEDHLADQETITGAYSQYLIAELVYGNNANRSDQKLRDQAEQILENYFVWSFFDKPLDPLTGTDPRERWNAALWELRTYFGREFADHALSRVIEVISETDSDRAHYTVFDSYFCWFMANGLVEASGGNGEKFIKAQNIMKSHALEIGECHP